MRWIESQRSRVGLVVADLPAHALGEHLGAAARQRIEPGRAQLDQHLLVALAERVGEERDLDRREPLEVDVRLDALEAREQLRRSTRTAGPGAGR